MKKKDFIKVLILFIFILSFIFIETDNSMVKAEIERGEVYTVRPGDSLWKISQEYMISIEEIKQANNLTQDEIYIDQQLIIPNQTREEQTENSYIVQAGDSLWLIAQEFESSVDEIKRKNNLSSDMIYIGQKLIIPGLNQKPEIKGIIQGKVAINNRVQENEEIEQVNAETTTIIPLTGIKGPENKKSEIIVKYKPLIDAQSRNEVEQQNNLIVLSEIELQENTVVHYEMENEDEIERLLDYYNSLETVEWAEKNFMYYPQIIPADPYYSHQWNLHNINMETAWENNRGDASVIVAVLDTGVITDHPDLKDNLLPGANFVGGERSYPIRSYTKTDDDPTDKTTKELGGSHGTHVSGIIGAVTNNYQGVAGINWDVSILPVKVMRKTGGTSWDIAEGIYYAIDQGADVINLSLGGNNFSNLQQEALKEAQEAEITVVAATGNDGQEGVYYPAAFSETIAVGAADSRNQVTAYSNYGPEVDLLAPGGGFGDTIYSTWGYFENGQTVSDYAGLVGTSMAAPHVSGTAALLVAQGMDSPDEIKERLIETTQTINDGSSKYYGHGLLDAANALSVEQNEINIEGTQVFAVTKENDKLIVQSEIVEADKQGFYRLTEFKSQEVYIAAWKDITETGELSYGDYFTISSNSYWLGEETVQEQDLQLELLFSSGIPEIIY